MIRVFRTHVAERDLEDIWLAIARDNPAAATRVIQAIGAQIERLSSFPRLGSRRPDIAPSARALVEGPYLILFETQPDTDDGPVEWVEIVRVVDGRRDLRDLG
ncbi:type II toxin-antitoxin system RelE/ParE family toxin [Niveispirillum sp. KHB5.9]|uniref:type II toxin-antitoxin system RelE/ParE family toxin n=1 Tax=Niveispirillum sp. KHB5.9 TaxID=3400269 RepID=UPI003A8BCF1F